MELNFQIGLSYFSEDLKTGDDKHYGIARICCVFAYQLTDTLTLTNNMVVFPNLNTVGDFILRDDALIDQKINKQWSFTIH